MVTTQTHTDDTGSSLTPQVPGPVSFVGYQACLRSCVQVLPKEKKKRRETVGDGDAQLSAQHVGGRGLEDHDL